MVAEMLLMEGAQIAVRLLALQIKHVIQVMFPVPVVLPIQDAPVLTTSIMIAPGEAIAQMQEVHGVMQAAVRQMVLLTVEAALPAGVTAATGTMEEIPEADLPGEVTRATQDHAAHGLLQITLPLVEAAAQVQVHLAEAVAAAVVVHAEDINPRKQINITFN